jgi:hypothetical protein
MKLNKVSNAGALFITSGFWPRVRARALRAPVFLGSFFFSRPLPIAASLLPPSPNKKINYFQKQNVFLQAQTRAPGAYIFPPG